MNLSPEQAAGLEKIKVWYADAREPFRLFGAAGTGKTTLAKYVPQALGLTGPHDVRYATYTGKAAHVLRSKGATPVSTIHSGIYTPGVDQEAVRELAKIRACLEPARATHADLTPADGAYEMSATYLAELEEALPAAEKAARSVRFHWNAESVWREAKLIILDEVSMVGPDLAQDIERFGVPVLVLGDPAQLPPVEGGGYYTSVTPDHLLDTVHRQALESPVLELATRVRRARGASLGLVKTDFRKRSLQEAKDADQVLTWTNHRRWAMVNAMRGEKPGRVKTYDKIMCLTNNQELGVFNGQQFTVLDTTNDSGGLVVLDDEGRKHEIDVFQSGFLGQDEQVAAKNSGAGGRGDRMLATYAQAITVHKSQGSEWPSVYIVNELDAMISQNSAHSGELAAYRAARRWLYTAVSRASESVTITAPRR